MKNFGTQAAEFIIMIILEMGIEDRSENLLILLKKILILWVKKQIKTQEIILIYFFTLNQNDSEVNYDIIYRKNIQKSILLNSS